MTLDGPRFTVGEQITSFSYKDIYESEDLNDAKSFLEKKAQETGLGYIIFDRKAGIIYKLDKKIVEKEAPLIPEIKEKPKKQSKSPKPKVVKRKK